MARRDGKQDVAALAETLRGRLGALNSIPAGALAEKRMFGGVCFLLNGNMLCGAGKNGYMMRVDRARRTEAQRLPGGRPVVMRGRAMAGFYWIDPALCGGEGLGRWLALAVDYVGPMPAKAGKKPR